MEATEQTLLKNTPLKILIWNLQDFFLFMDKYQGQEISEITEPKWQLLTASLKDNKELHKIKDISYLIKKMKVDICFFTEIGGEESLQNLNEYFLDSDYKVFHKASNSDRGIDIGILCKKEYQSLTKFKMHNDKVFARGVMQFELHLEAGREVRFLLTHLKSKLNKVSDFEGRNQRKLEVEKIIQIYEKSNKKMEMPTFVCGDLNSIIAGEETEPELKQFASKLGLKDAFELLKYDHFDRGTYVYYNKIGNINLMQLDYALLHPKWAHIIGVESQVLGFDGEKKTTLPTSRKDRAKLPSDHYPIFLEINLG